MRYIQRDFAAIIADIEGVAIGVDSTVFAHTENMKGVGSQKKSCSHSGFVQTIRAFEPSRAVTVSATYCADLNAKYCADLNAKRS